MNNTTTPTRVQLNKWIEAVETSLDGNMPEWDIRSIQQGSIIGTIEWYPPWRKFCLSPNYNTVYEWDCLRAIAAFCQLQTSLKKKPTH